MLTVCARKTCFLMHHHFDIVHRRYGVKPRCAGGAGYSPPPVNATCAALLRTLCPHVAPPYDCNGWSDVYPPLNKSFACSAGCLQNKNVTNALRKVSRTSSAVVPRSACRIQNSTCSINHLIAECAPLPLSLRLCLSISISIFISPCLYLSRSPSF